MTQNDDIVMSRIAFVCEERASQLRPNRPKRKERGSHAKPRNDVREVVALEGQTLVIFVGRDVGEKIGLLPRFLHLWSSEARQRPAVLTLNGYGLNESIGIRYWQ